MKKVFLERLVKGKASLYYYKGKNTKTFFLEKDSTIFIELPENDSIGYKDILKEFTNDCQNVLNATKLVRYNKKSLSILTNRYNGCVSGPFPFFKFGITVGLDVNKYIPSSNYFLPKYKYLIDIEFKYKVGFMFGVFIDNPIAASNFSFHTELNYLHSNFSCKDPEYSNDISISTSTLNIPVLFRYTYPSVKYRPFINIGGNYNLNFSNDDSEDEVSAESLISNNQIGFSIGVGVQHKHDYRKSTFVEIRYNKIYGIFAEETFNNIRLQLLTGINF